LSFEELLGKFWCTNGPCLDLFFALWLWSRLCVLGSADTRVKTPSSRSVQCSGKKEAKMHLHCWVFWQENEFMQRSG